MTIGYITLRVGLFFDGTGNNQTNSDMGSSSLSDDLRTDSSYGNATSNVARLYGLYPEAGSTPIPAGAGMAYLKVYLEGIGTRSGHADSGYSKGTGRGETGVIARVEQVPGLMEQQFRRFRTHNPNRLVDRLEVDLFGFSRGAAAARHCANDLLKGPGSLLAKAMPSPTPGFAPTFAWRHGRDLELEFIGLFDTVAAIVAPLRLDLSPHNALNPGINLRLAPGTARRVAQLVAADEYRHNFSLTCTDNDLAMPGCHSDIGGGYRPLVTEDLLLCKPDSSISPLQEPSQHSEAFRRIQHYLECSREHWADYFPADGLSIVTWDEQIPQRERNTPLQKRVYAALAGERKVRGELSLVYLRVMRELGIKAGIAFNAINALDPKLSLPAELAAIAAKLQADALRGEITPLDADERLLLSRQYIHLSAHWRGAKDRSTSDLDVMFIDRPAEGGQRMRHSP